MARKRNTKTTRRNAKKPGKDTSTHSEKVVSVDPPITSSLSLSDTLVFVTLTLVCLVIFGQVVRFDFINLDDNLYVYTNQFVSQGLTLQGIKWAFTSFHAANWHPLTWISHMIDVNLFGVDPGMIHAVNVIFHLVNSILVFSVFQN